MYRRKLRMRQGSLHCKQPEATTARDYSISRALPAKPMIALVLTGALVVSSSCTLGGPFATCAPLDVAQSCFREPENADSMKRGSLPRFRRGGDAPTAVHIYATL